MRCSAILALVFAQRVLHAANRALHLAAELLDLTLPLHLFVAGQFAEVLLQLADLRLCGAPNAVLIELR
jgi:hypothetical protein